MFKPAALAHEQVVAHHRTGSNYTCDPAVTDTDIDWLVLVADFPKYWIYLTEDNGWTPGGSSVDAIVNDERAVFAAFRKGVHNLIVVNDPEYYDRLVLATEMAKRFNLLEKEDRVLLFEVVADKTVKTMHCITEKLLF